MIISIFKSISKAYVDLEIDLPWDNIVEVLTEHHDVAGKADVEMFNLAEFKKLDDPTTQLARRYKGSDVNGVWMRDPSGAFDEIPDTVRRCKANLVSISGIILDIDEKMSIVDAMETLDGLEYVIYTTFRHTLEKNKFRVVIPFAKPLLAADIESRQQDIIDTFPGVDNCSFTMSQSFYLHSGKNDPIAYHNKGVMLDPYLDFAVAAPVQAPVVTKQQISTITDIQATSYKKAVLDSLMQCSGLHYAGQGGNNHAILTLISICRSIDLNYNEYDVICQKLAHPDSALVRSDIRRMAWTGWAGDKVKAATRDEFLTSYGGTAIRKPNWKDVRKDLANKYLGE